jgi:hypothetical protein
MIHRLIIIFWNIWDKFYYHCTRLHYVDREHSLFRVVVKKYRGEEIHTKDGITLKKGDWFVQLHLHNARLALLLQKNGQRDFARVVTMRKLILSSLPRLLPFIEQHPRHAQIQVILGTTLLHHGAERIGFETSSLPDGKRKWLKTWVARLILFLCRPTGWKEWQKRRQEWIPKRVFISKNKLKQLYGTGVG